MSCLVSPPRADVRKGSGVVVDSGLFLHCCRLLWSFYWIIVVSMMMAGPIIEIIPIMDLEWRAQRGGGRPRDRALQALQLMHVTVHDNVMPAKSLRKCV